VGAGEGQGLIQLLALASLRGLIVRGPMIGKQHAYVLVRDWLGEQPAVDRDAALAELARRYLAGHGPADERDLAKWAGIGLRDARAGFETIASEVVEVGHGAMVPAKGTGRAARRRPALPPPRLLGAFDPVLLGWASRDDVVGPHGDAVAVGGIFRSFALVGGRAVATWSLAGGEVALEPLEPIAPEDRAALDAEALDVRRFLGL
ncbi:MAG TPA: crosslink repair DNA glycosylase YcaQ family protein, partial [Solirubrobacteraceae bacterium]